MKEINWTSRNTNEVFNIAKEQWLVVATIKEKKDNWIRYILRREGNETSFKNTILTIPVASHCLEAMGIEGKENYKYYTV